MHNSIRKTRINYIDMAKGICILLVILGHQVGKGSGLRLSIYSFHMALFFILSGMVDVKTGSYRKSRAVFYSRKAQGLLLPYLFWSFVFIGVDFIRIILKQKPANVIIIDIIQFLSGFGINVLWFLITLFICQIIIYELKQRYGQSRVLAIVFAFALIANEIYYVLYLYFFAGETVIVYRIIQWCICSCIRPLIVLPFLVIGEIILKFTENVSWKKIGLYSVIFIVFNIVFAIRFNLDVDIVNVEYKNIAYVYSAGITGSLFVISLCRWIEKESYSIFVRLLTFFGTHSLLIMVLHEYIPLRKLATICIPAICPQKLQMPLEYFLWLGITLITMLCVEKPYRTIMRWITGRFVENTKSNYQKS